MLYRIIKILIRIGMRLYYSEVKVKHKNNLQHDGPMIIIANHPNTLVDAWLIGNICPQPIHFMTKGTFFNNPIKMWFLRSLNLVPINRATESKTKGVNNDQSFEECFKLLEKGKTLVIYPEGNSFMERKLRQLKSGTARIALEAENRNDGKLNLLVVPMGLIYLKANKFRSSVLVNVGKGEKVTHHLEEFKTSNITAAKKLTEEFRVRLEQVLVTAESAEQEQLIEDLTDIVNSRYRKDLRKGIEKDVDLMKKIKDRIEEINLIRPYEISEIQDLMLNIKWRLEKLKIKSDFLDRRFRSRMFTRQIFTSILFVIVGLPMFLFGVIHNILPYKLTDLLMPRLVKNVEYYAPVAILLGLVLYPLNYILLIYATDSFLQFTFWYKLIYFLLMPVFGLYSYYFAHYLKHISFKWNYIFLVMNQRGAVRELQEKRQRLIDLLFN